MCWKSILFFLLCGTISYLNQIFENIYGSQQTAWVAVMKCFNSLSFVWTIPVSWVSKTQDTNQHKNL